MSSNMYDAIRMMFSSNEFTNRNINQFPIKMSLNSFLKSKKIQRRVQQIRKTQQIQKSYQLAQAKAIIQRADKNQHTFPLKKYEKRLKNYVKKQSRSTVLSQFEELKIQKQPIRCMTQASSSKPNHHFGYSMIARKKSRRIGLFSAGSRIYYNTQQLSSQTLYLTQGIKGKNMSVKKLDLQPRKIYNNNSNLKQRVLHKSRMSIQKINRNITSRSQNKIKGWQIKPKEQQQTAMTKLY